MTHCIQNEDGGQVDKYLVYGEEYKAVRDAVAKAVVDGSIEKIEDVCEVTELHFLKICAF